MKDAVKCWMSVLYCAQCRLVSVSVSQCVDCSYAAILFIAFETVSSRGRPILDFTDTDS